MESSTIQVRFRKTGEHFHVPVSGTTTIKDIIKYVCEKSIDREKIDYNNYFLALLNNDLALHDDSLFEEVRPYRIENPDYQVRMKTPKRGNMVMLLREYLKAGRPRHLIESEVLFDDTDSNIEMETNESQVASLTSENINTDQPGSLTDIQQIDSQTEPSIEQCENTSALLQLDSNNESSKSNALISNESDTLANSPSKKDDDEKPVSVPQENSSALLQPNSINEISKNNALSKTDEIALVSENSSSLFESNNANDLSKIHELPNTTLENFCGTSSNNDGQTEISASTNSKLDTSSPSATASQHVQSAQQELSGPQIEPSLDDQTSFLARPQKLASTYQRFTGEVNKIVANVTRDPVVRRSVTENFNEINILLCGAPRVGKSTLINAICGKQLAKALPGLRACTTQVSAHFLKGTFEVGSESINYRYNFWDTPGIEKWNSEQIRKMLEDIKRMPRSDILCMIYCASPGSFANLEQLDRLLKECIDQQIFCALVCTNKWGGSAVQHDAVMNDFQRLLEKYHCKTREEHDIIFFGNMGLCTSVNSEPFVIHRINVTLEPSGIDELILGIMESLDDEKLAQWCMLAFENRKFLQNFTKFPSQLKSVWNKLLRKK